jgi:MarR family 2-MHQ and catechol resistance regulon transcriptional repressor
VKIEDHLAQPHFENDAQRLHLHILVVARQLDLLLRRMLKPHGLTPPQYNVLRILRGQKGQPIAVHSLAARMVDPSSNTSRIVDKLVDKGWADRKVCPEDRRRANVSITPSGLALLASLDDQVHSVFHSTLASLPTSTLDTMNAGLAKVLDTTDDVLSSQH